MGAREGTGEAAEGSGPAGLWSCAGLGCVAMATLLHEIVLTRIFSVITWYHFAFIAISVAMFGLTAGAILIDAGRRFFAREKTRRHMALASLLFALALPACLVPMIRIPFSTDPTPGAILADAIILLLSAVPFCLSGVAVGLALTRFPGQVGRLYAADLTGAALACLAVIPLLKTTDGPTAVFAAGALAAAGAACFAIEAETDGRLVRLSLVAAVVLMVFVFVNGALARAQAPLLRIAAVKGHAEEPAVYEAWNAYSRVRVRRAPRDTPLGWGLSAAYTPVRPVRQMILDIDGGASTVVTEYHGRPEEVDHLRWDITGMAHVLRPGGRVLVIGVGGGRDVLTALVYGQPEVVGVEVNETILHAVTDVFGDFTGHLDRDPRVTLIHDEARSQIARRRDRFDIIQASLVDTSAATAAGAFAFTENALYTREGWRLFLDRLRPRGVLAFSWFFSADRPVEMYRLTALAQAALADRGIADPRRHILLAWQGPGKSHPVGSILVSPDPFDEADVARLQQWVAPRRFEIILAPGVTTDAVFDALATGAAGPLLAGDPPLRVDPPTDDSPFFFNVVRLRDALRPRVAAQGTVAGNQKAVTMLGALLLASTLAAAACLVVPIARAGRRPDRRAAVPDLFYFAALGVGFMLVEIAQLQRLILLLGQPTLGLAVVLFALLLAGGAGSLSIRDLPAEGLARAATLRLAGLLAVLLAVGLATPFVVHRLAGATTPVRIAGAVALLLPLGFFMGMAFPLGMRFAAARAHDSGPWFWAVNGAASVWGSVLATALSLAFGIGATFWFGTAAYATALCLRLISCLWDRPALE
ncbi:MAG TPA: hypothetical protein VFQ07_06115 [Candidatus Polarisedimenticolia bacterium]|nr:hypothetical protein [Candidatus Polarisedimenticolia bacterium]